MTAHNSYHFDPLYLYVDKYGNGITNVSVRGPKWNMRSHVLSTFAGGRITDGNYVGNHLGDITAGASVCEQGGAGELAIQHSRPPQSGRSRDPLFAPVNTLGFIDDIRIGRWCAQASIYNSRDDLEPTADWTGGFVYTDDELANGFGGEESGDRSNAAAESS